MHLNEKTMDPVGGTLWCRLDTSLHHLTDENLNQTNKRSLGCELCQLANRKSEYKKSNDVQVLPFAPLFVVLPCIS